MSRTATELRLTAALSAALRVDVKTLLPISGGDINKTYRGRLADGRSVFVKTNPDAPTGFYPAEAHGLDWLRAASALRVPDVLAHGYTDDGHPFLALEFIEPGPRARDFDEALGRGLAALHRAGAPSFGLDRPNFIGSLVQDNTPANDWPEFFRARRLMPQLRQLVDARLAPSGLERTMERVFARLPELCGPPEPPARLHGDLWAGNHLCDEAGYPVLVDPSVYGGHREVDLAMMRLFGGFSARVFAAYAEAYPLAPDAEARLPLYQLYPLLVHANLFGGGYALQALTCARRLA